MKCLYDMTYEHIIRQIWKNASDMTTMQAKNIYMYVHIYIPILILTDD